MREGGRKGEREDNIGENKRDFHLISNVKYNIKFILLF